MVGIGRRFRAVVLIGVLASGVTTVVVSSPALAGGGGPCHDPKHVSSSSVAVDAKESCFFPTILYVDEGATVTWTKRDHAGTP